MSARVVVTGAGVISSIGAGLEEFERNLYAGCSGIGPSPLLGETAYASLRDVPGHHLDRSGPGEFVEQCPRRFRR